MKFAAWSEQRDVRAIQTGDGLLTVHRGDVVVIAVVERWDDAEKAIAELCRLTGKPPAVEEP
jgi:hypothetical protein